MVLIRMPGGMRLRRGLGVSCWWSSLPRAGTIPRRQVGLGRRDLHRRSAPRSDPRRPTAPRRALTLVGCFARQLSTTRGRAGRLLRRWVRPRGASSSNAAATRDSRRVGREGGPERTGSRLEPALAASGQGRLLAVVEHDCDLSEGHIWGGQMGLLHSALSVVEVVDQRPIGLESSRRITL